MAVHVSPYEAVRLAEWVGRVLHLPAWVAATLIGVASFTAGFFDVDLRRWLRRWVP